jgi:hypothetical protein
MNAALTEPLEHFLNAVGSQETKRQYRKKIELFLSRVEIEGTGNESQAANRNLS